MGGMFTLLFDFLLTPAGWVAVVVVAVGGYLAYRWTFSD